MPHATAFDQMEQLLAQILDMISGAFKGLRHEQHRGAVVPATALAAFQMAAKYRLASAVNLGVGLQHPGSRFEIALQKAAMDGFEHLLEDLRHGDQVASVIAQQPYRQVLQALGHGIGKVADALQVDDELEASQQLAGLGLGDRGDGGGNFLVNSALHAVEFFLAVLDRNERHIGGILDEVAEVERRVFPDQAGLQHQASQFLGGFRLRYGPTFHATPAGTCNPSYRSQLSTPSSPYHA